MALLAACADGNLTSASTWALINAASLLNSETANTALTTSFVSSSTFTPGAITIDGLAIKLASRAESPSGTLEVELRQGGVAVPGTSVSCNVADLPTASVFASNGGLEGGWVFFKFAAPVALAAATLYTIAARTSVTNQVNLFRDSTAGNWSRYLRTTTTQAPVAGDDLIIGGEKTGPGAETSRTVDMDSTAATDYGANANSSVTPSLAIGGGGTLQFLTTASTDFLLRISGRVVVYANGSLTLGTELNPVPRSSTAFLELDSTVDGGSAIDVRNYGSIKLYGQSRTAGNESWYCKLSSSASAGALSLSVDTDTGWLDNDQIMILSTSRSNTENEIGLLNGAAGASSLTIDGFTGAGGGLAFAHTVLNLVAAEVALLTRNVGIRSTSTTNLAYLKVWQKALIEAKWASFYYMGTASPQVAGVEILSDNDPVLISHCSFAHTEHTLLYVTPIGDPGITIENCAFYGSNNSSPVFRVGGNVGNNITVNGLLGCRVGSGSGILIDNSGGAISNITFVGAVVNGVAFSAHNQGTIDNITGRAAGTGISFGNGPWDGCQVTNIYGIRNSTGINFSVYSVDEPFQNITAVGNSTNSLSGFGPIIIDNLVVGGETGFTTSQALSSWSSGELVVNGGTSGTSGGYLNHAFNIVNLSNGTSTRVVFNNFLYGDSSPVSTSNRHQWQRDVRVSFMKHQGVSNTHFTYAPFGNTELDEAVYVTMPPSEKLTPISSSNRHRSQSRHILVNNGETKTVSVMVRKDASYNGNAARLVVNSNSAVGVSFSVLDQMTVGADTWEVLTGAVGPATDTGVIEVYVDCDGTAGSLYVDEWGAA